VHYAQVVESTNATALRLAEEGAPEWTLVAAGHQTGGRGRLGRRWESVPGGALLFSVVLRPALLPESAPLLTLLAGAAMVTACHDVLGATAACKWPNDIVVGREKVGGILAEARVTEDRVDHVVLGVGVNLGTAPDIEGAGALPNGDRAGLLGSFLAQFAVGYRRTNAEFVEWTLGRYRPLCDTLGVPVRARTSSGEEIEGVAEGLGENGALLVRTGGDVVAVGFGEVTHLRR
jgi:BirA family transcriptional regulator, biotin operon repressor / biotin---[acetyl-CoA-carboxylase] ligase